MKIAYVLTRADAVGGASIHVRDMAMSMMERGHRVQVFIGGVGHVTTLLETESIPFKPLVELEREVSPMQDYRAYGELKQALRSFAPDLISAHTAKAGWLGRAAARSLGIPCIYTPHGWNIADRQSKMQRQLYTMAERMAAPWADAIVCVSEAERRLAIEKGVGRPDQLHVIHNGVRDVAADMRAKPGEENPRLACIARFEHPKDHRLLLDALMHLHLHVSDWEIDLVGDGPLQTDIRSYSVAIGLRARVNFCGYMADPAPVLARAQLFVLASRSEGFPRSILEAMRAGLPIVASDVGGIREAVPDSVVAAGNADAMGKAILNLMNNPQLRIDRGAVARAAYEEHFRLERMVYKTETLYKSVLA